MGSSRWPPLSSLTFPSRLLSLTMWACSVARCWYSLPVPALDWELPEGSHSDRHSHPYISSSQLTFVEEMDDKFETLIMSWHHLIFRILFVCRYFKLLFVFFSVGVNNGPSELYTEICMVVPLSTPTQPPSQSHCPEDSYCCWRVVVIFLDIFLCIFIYMKIKISMLMLCRYIFAHISV